ncbi:homeodomain-interacting protein kinase 2-like isoform 1-T1 [Synchiropus picturatus]
MNDPFSTSAITSGSPLLSSSSLFETMDLFICQRSIQQVQEQKKAARVASNAKTQEVLKPGHILHSHSNSYKILEYIGEGTFGKVAKCLSLLTGETVAVKIFFQDTDCFLQCELSILKHVSSLDYDETHLVKFFEHFQYMGNSCLVFELLDKSMFCLLEENDWRPLSLSQIRCVAEELFLALVTLKSLGVVHADIKPDNIMLVCDQRKLRAKLIDFGGAVLISKIRHGMIVQALGYRAPEVTLGLPLTEAVDVWAVGCVLAFLCLGDNLFSKDCEYLMMKNIVELLGQPEDHLLSAGIHTRFFFIEETGDDGPQWRLMTPEEFKLNNCMEVERESRFAALPWSLRDLAKKVSPDHEMDLGARFAFVDLMEKLLRINSSQRITAHEALQHPFITKSYLSHGDDLNCASSLNDSDETVQSIPSSESRIERKCSCIKQIFSSVCCSCLCQQPVLD